MRRSIKLTLALGGAVALAAVAGQSASALPADTSVKAAAANATAVGYDTRHHYRRHHGPRYGYYHRPRYGYVPYPGLQRGFMDPGTAYHGNLNGCAVDLGYGRWESCDVSR